MLTTSLRSLRRHSGQVLTLLIASVSLGATAQTPTTISTQAVAVPHTGTFGAPWQSAVSNRGDFLLYDFKTDGLYEFPANGGAEITIAAPGKIAGGFTNSGIAVDPRNNNLYLDNNYNGGLIEFPFDAATGQWDLPRVVVAGGLAGDLGGACGNYFQGAGLAINDNGLMAVATENGCGTEVFTTQIDASGNFGPATPLVTGMKSRAKTLAIDNAGNIFYGEDGGTAGILFIPAGTPTLAGDTTAIRIDPIITTAQGPTRLTAIQGVTIDRAGNAYIADGTGLYRVPMQAGMPNPNAATLLSPVPASGGPSFDAERAVVFYPTSGSGAIKDLVKIYLARAEFGPVTAATANGTPATATVSFMFYAAATPYSFALTQPGATTTPFALGDLSGCGITFTTTTDPKTNKTTTTENTVPYAAAGNCAIPVTFTPTAQGDAVATLTMLDQKGNVLGTSVLHGTGVSPLITVTPAVEAAIGTGFKAPSQVAADTQGNVYVADSGLGKVLQYAKGASSTSTPVSLGTGLKAPTGVAVDSLGDVFIADSGSVIEIPYGATSLNAAGQSVLKTGLGTNLKLATDTIGDVFVADPDNQRVVRLRTTLGSLEETDTTGLTQLTAIASDGAGDLFVANGSNLLEYFGQGQQSLLTSLAGANGLAVDASGSVYVTSAAQTVRILSNGGTYSGAPIPVATGVAQPVSVAVDPAGNAYVLDQKSGSVDFINANGFLNLGTLANTTSTATASATMVNDGNAPLNITGFSSTSAYSVTANTCVGAPVAVGGTCSATVTFNPGPGDQGRLTGLLAAASDAVETPVGINVTGVGAALAASTATITVTKPTVTGAPVVVAVTSTSGTGLVPTGNATVTVTGPGFPAVVTTLPLVNGGFTINETTLGAGADTFTVTYAGDRVYGRSTATTQVTVAQGTVTLIQPAASTVPTYVLAGTNAQQPYDGSILPYFYIYPVSVKTANGAPLVPTVSTVNGMTVLNYGLVSYQVASGAPACVGSGSMINVMADGTASLPAMCLAVDASNNQIPSLVTPYTVTPVYTGANYTTVTGTPVTFLALRNPAVVITASPNTLSVAAGSTATTTLTLTSLLGYGVTGVNGNLNNYSLPVELECDALPAHSSCSFSYPTPDPSDPNSTAVTPTAPGKVIMTINTNVAVGTAKNSYASAGPTFAALFGLSMLGLAYGRKKTLKAGLLRAGCLLLFCGTLAGLSACSTKNISAVPVLTTPKGSFTVRVTAKQTGSKQVPSTTLGGAPVTVYGNGNLMSVPFTVSVTVQ